MKRVRVEFRPEAVEDLINLFDYIAAEAGGGRAGAYIERIEDACMALSTFPERGTRRDDLQPGIRTVGFERRATIVFRVIPESAEIIRIFYGGQDFESVFRP